MPKLKLRYLFILFIGVILLIAIPLSFLYIQNKQNNQAEILTEHALAITKDSPTLQNRIIPKLEALNNSQLNDEEKYKSIKDLVFFFGAYYSEKNDPVYKKFVSELGEYSKNKLSSQYKENDFLLTCQDSTCSDSNPDEVKNLLSLIESSDFPQEIKTAYTTNIRNINFIENKYKQEKAEYFYAMYVDLRVNPVIASSSSLTKITDEFSRLIQENYANQSKGLEEEYKKNNPLLK